MSINPNDLNFALNLPPEKVSSYFRDKVNLPSYNWDEVWQENNTKIFTVAKAMRVDILEDIRTAMQSAIDEGKTFQQFQKELTPILKNKGWWGKEIHVDSEGVAKKVQLGSPWRLRTIYQTNMQTAYMTGRYREMIESTERSPYWRYNAIMDSHTRPSHAALNGKIFRYDDPFWNTHFPPNGFRCRCSVRPLTAKAVEQRGLTVDSSEGKMLYKVVPRSKNSDQMTIASGIKIHDEKSGNFPVVWTDPGWAYNPGRVNYHTDLWAAGKLKKCPEVLQENYLKEMANNPWHKKAFSNFVDKVLENKGENKGLATVAGYLNPKAYKAITAKFEKSSAPVVVMDDIFINHALSKFKETTGQKVAIEQLKNIPEILNNPEAIIIDNHDPALLFVIRDNLNKNKSLKTVIKLNRRVNKIKEAVTIITTISSIENQELKHSWQELIYGEIKQ